MLLYLNAIMHTGHTIISVQRPDVFTCLQKPTDVLMLGSILAETGFAFDFLFGTTVMFFVEFALNIGTGGISSESELIATSSSFWTLMMAEIDGLKLLYTSRFSTLSFLSYFTFFGLSRH
jgi:hypothetical protein